MISPHALSELNKVSVENVSVSLLQFNCGDYNLACQQKRYLDPIFKANCVVQSKVGLTVSMGNHPRHLLKELCSGFLLLDLDIFAEKLVINSKSV